MILCLAVSLIVGAPHPQQPKALAVVGATLIDGTGAPPMTDATILVRDGRIVAIGKGDAVKIPPDADQIDATGKWIIPGLIDMHVHLDEVITPSAFVLFGVTTVRDVGSRLVTLQKLRARAMKGEVMPRFYWLGRNIDQGKPSWWGAVAVKDSKGAPALLDDMARQGVDGVKLYVLAGPGVTRAVIREGHRRGWPVTAHLQDTLPSAAARMGIDNLEHISTLMDELRHKPNKRVTGYLRGFVGVQDVDLNGPAAKRLIEAIRKNDVAITATLAVALMPVEGEKGAQARYEGWADVPASWRKEWARPYWDFISTKGWTARDFSTARSAYKNYEEMVNKLDRAGVKIVAGTDTPAPWVLPGAGLVCELELLVKAGVSPMSAIRAATGRAAEVLRKDGEVGTLRRGRRADFIILGSDPLKDIRSLRRPEGVYVGGIPLDLPAIKSMFDQAH